MKTDDLIAMLASGPDVAAAPPPGMRWRTAGTLGAGLLASDENQFNRIGVRVHDVDSPFFARDVEIVCAAAQRLAYIAVPKVGGVQDAIQFIATLRQTEDKSTLPIGRRRPQRSSCRWRVRA